MRQSLRHKILRRNHVPLFLEYCATITQGRWLLVFSKVKSATVGLKMIERGQCLNRVVFTTARVIFNKIVKLPSNPITQVQAKQSTYDNNALNRRSIVHIVCCTCTLNIKTGSTQFHQLFFFSEVVRKVFEQRLRVFFSIRTNYSWFKPSVQIF